MSSLLFYTKTNSTPRKTPLSGIFTIGSEANADIRLNLRSEYREPVYCVIDATENSVIVENKAKLNPILINGVKMKKTALKDGDKLDIAGKIFEFQAAEQTTTPMLRRQTLHPNFTSKVTRIPLPKKQNKRVLLRKSLNLSTMKSSRYSKRSSLGAKKQSPRSNTNVDEALTPSNIGTLRTKANTTGRISNERRSIKTPRRDSLRISLFKNSLGNKTNISKESPSVLDTIDLLSSSSDSNRRSESSSFMIELDSPAATAKQRKSSCTRPTPKKQCCLDDSVPSILNIPTITESCTESESINSPTPNNTPVKITRKSNQKHLNISHLDEYVTQNSVRKSTPRSAKKQTPDVRNSSSKFDLMTSYDEKDNSQIVSPIKRRATNQKLLNISEIEEYTTENSMRKSTPQFARKQTPNPRKSSSKLDLMTSYDEKDNSQIVSPVKRRTTNQKLLNISQIEEYATENSMGKLTPQSARKQTPNPRKSSSKLDLMTSYEEKDNSQIVSPVKRRTTNQKLLNISQIEEYATENSMAKLTPQSAKKQTPNPRKSSSKLDLMTSYEEKDNSQIVSPVKRRTTNQKLLNISQIEEYATENSMGKLTPQSARKQTPNPRKSSSKLDLMTSYEEKDNSQIVSPVKRRTTNQKLLNISQIEEYATENSMAKLTPQSARKQTPNPRKSSSKLDLMTSYDEKDNSQIVSPVKRRTTNQKLLNISQIEEYATENSMGKLTPQSAKKQTPNLRKSSSKFDLMTSYDEKDNSQIVSPVKRRTTNQKLLNISHLEEYATENSARKLTPRSAKKQTPDVRKSSSKFDVMTSYDEKDNSQIVSPVKRRTTNQKFLNISNIEEYATENCVRKLTPRSTKKQTPNPRSSSSNYEKSNSQIVSPVKRRTRSSRLTKTPKSVTPYKTTKTPRSIKKLQNNDSLQSIESEFWSPVSESRRSSLSFNVSDLITDKINVDDDVKITTKNNLSKTPTPAKAKGNTSFKDINSSSPLKTMKTPKIGIDATTKTPKLFKKSLIQNTPKNADYSEILSPIEEGQRSSIDINNRTFDLNKSHESELNDSNIKITPRQSVRLSKPVTIKVGKTPKKDASLKVSKTPKAETSVQIIKTPASANRTKTPKSEISTRKSRPSMKTKTPKTGSPRTPFKHSPSPKTLALLSILGVRKPVNKRLSTPKSASKLTKAGIPKNDKTRRSTSYITKTEKSTPRFIKNLHQTNKKTVDESKISETMGKKGSLLGDETNVESDSDLFETPGSMGDTEVEYFVPLEVVDRKSSANKSVRVSGRKKSLATRGVKRLRESTNSVIQVSKRKKMVSESATELLQDNIFNSTISSDSEDDGELFQSSQEFDDDELNSSKGIENSFNVHNITSIKNNITINIQNGIVPFDNDSRQVQNSSNNITLSIEQPNSTLQKCEYKNSPQIKKSTRISGRTKRKFQRSPENNLVNIPSIKAMFATPKYQKSPLNDLSNVAGVKGLLRTPKEIKSPKNDLRKIQGIKKMFATPKPQNSPKNDLTDVKGIKKMFGTPKETKSPRNDLTRVSGVKKMFATPKEQKSPKNDLTRVSGVKKMFATPKEQKSPKNDLTRVSGVKKTFATPKEQKSPKNDLTRVSGVKKMFATPKEQKSPKNDLTRVSGVKKMFATPKQQHSPLNDLRNIVNIKSLMKTPRPPPKSPKNDLTDITGVKQMMRTPRLQKSPRNDLTQIVNIKELMQTPVQNVSINNVEVFTEDGKKSALFDLTNVNNSSQENVVDKLFKETRRISRKLEKENLEEPKVLTEKVNLKESPENQKKTRSRKGVSKKNQATETSDNGESNNLNENAVNIEIDILDPTLTIKRTARSRNNVQKSNSIDLIEENSSSNIRNTRGKKILNEEKNKETAPQKTTRSKRVQKNNEIESKDAQKDSLSKRGGRKRNNNTKSNAKDDADAATKPHESNDKESTLGNSKESDNSELAIEKKSPAKRNTRRKKMEDKEEPQKDLLSVQPTSVKRNLRRKGNDEEGNAEKDVPSANLTPVKRNTRKKKNNEEDNTAKDAPSANPTRVKRNAQKKKGDDTEQAVENTQPSPVKRNARKKKTGGEAETDDVNAKPTAVKRNTRKNKNADETEQIVLTEKTPPAKRTTRKRKGETEEPEQDNIVDKTKKTTNQNSRKVDEHENETKSVGKRRKLYKKTDLEQLEEPQEEEPEKRSLRTRRQRT